jgi:D-serine deaminase-like pyridoxal phosphate-dependent protein
MGPAELETPVPVVDLDRLEANIEKMQAYCNLHGLRLRPHIKTHKSAQIAKMQINRGAVGLTCQKIREAEVMEDAGFTDLLLSYPQVGVGRVSRLAWLARRINLSLYVDGEVSFETATQAAAAAEKTIGIWIDFDSGAFRTGVQTPEDAARLAKSVDEHPFLIFVGLATYPLLPRSADFYAEFVALWGRPVGFSGAGTPTAWTAHETKGLTEVRQGTYVFHDRSTVGDGSATLDECAYHVLSTVIARPTSTRAILDAGSKSLTSDRVSPSGGDGFGLILEYPDLSIVRLYEEHAVVSVPDGHPGLSVGERVTILPNHVCPSLNLHDRLQTVRSGVVQAPIEITARGLNR